MCEMTCRISSVKIGSAVACVESNDCDLDQKTDVSLSSEKQFRSVVVRSVANDVGYFV